MLKMVNYHRLASGKIPLQLDASAIHRDVTLPEDYITATSLPTSGEATSSSTVQGDDVPQEPTRS
ncbi:MAG: hypothetical protein ACFCBW_09370 [Candidatus Competibacterales bacterium]